MLTDPIRVIWSVCITWPVSLVSFTQRNSLIIQCCWQTTSLTFTGFTLPLLHEQSVLWVSLRRRVMTASVSDERLTEETQTVGLHLSKHLRSLKPSGTQIMSKPVEITGTSSNGLLRCCWLIDWEMKINSDMFKDVFFRGYSYTAHHFDIT